MVLERAYRKWHLAVNVLADCTTSFAHYSTFFIEAAGQRIAIMKRKKQVITDSHSRLLGIRRLLCTRVNWSLAQKLHSTPVSALSTKRFPNLTRHQLTLLM